VHVDLNELRPFRREARSGVPSGFEKPHSAKSRGRARNFRRIVTFSDSISPDTLRLNPNTSFVEATWYWHGLLGTSVAEKASFFSRFFYKILEIMGAAVATAVSGYLVAHLGGFLPSQNQAPTPPEVVAVPSERPAPKSVPGNPPASQTATVPQPTQSAAVPPLPEARPASAQPDPTGSASQTVVRKTAKAQPPVRKTGKPETATTESKPESKPRDSIEAKLRETTEAKPRDPAEGKPRDAAEAKPRDPETKARDAEDKESVEARIRAALANVDANRPPSTVPARPGEASPGVTATIPAHSLESPSTSPNAGGSAGQPPRAADLGSAGQQPTASPQSPAVQSAVSAAPAQAGPPQPITPQQPEALTTVEIKSRPVATVETQRPPEPAPAPEEKGVLSVIKHILPDFSRPVSNPTSNDETPRPPAAVGD
jgi:hypothetical protein